MRVGQLVRRDVATIGTHATVMEAARCMRCAHAGAIVVLAGGDDRSVPVGVLTERGLLDKLLETNARGLARREVGEVLRGEPAVACDSDDVGEVAGRMLALGVRDIPIVDGTGALVGVLTLDDLEDHGDAAPSSGVRPGPVALRARAGGEALALDD